jgi:hypothetical protein
MASLSANTTIKINGAISASAVNVSVTPVTLYTAPANGYAIINATLAIGTTLSSCDLRVGGNTVFSASGISAFKSSNGSSSTTIIESLQDILKHTATMSGIYVGPGQSVEFYPSNYLNQNTARISGVEFINTP